MYSEYTDKSAIPQEKLARDPVRAILANLYDNGIDAVPLAGGKGPATHRTRAQVAGFSAMQARRQFAKKYSLKNIAAWCGTPSGFLFILDADNAAARHQILDAIERLHLENTWLVDTSTKPDGEPGLHVYFRAPWAVEGASAKGDFAFDLRGQNSYALAPGTVHPKTGEVYTRIDSAGGILELDPDDLARLNEALRPLYGGDVLRRATVAQVANFPRKGWKLLRANEADLCGYPTRSEKYFAAVMSFAACGHRPPAIKALFERFLDGSGFEAKHDLPRWVEGQYKRAQAALCRAKGERARICDNLEAFAAAWNWRGVAGRTDRRVVLTVCDIAREHGLIEEWHEKRSRSVTVAVPVIEISDRTGKQWQTAARSLRRILGGPFPIARERDATLTFARVVRLSDTQPARRLELRFSPNSGIFYGVAGDSLFACYAVLEEHGPQKIAAIARAAKLHRNTAAKAVTRGEKIGLFKRSRGKIAVNEKADESAMLERTTGKERIASRRRQNRAQRLRHKKFIVAETLSGFEPKVHK